MKKGLLIGTILLALLSGKASEVFPAYTGDIYPTPRNIIIGKKDFNLTQVSITGMENSPQRQQLEFIFIWQSPTPCPKNRKAIP